MIQGRDINAKGSFAGSLLADVPIVEITPMPGGHGLSVGICATEMFGDSVIGIALQGGETVKWGTQLTVDQALSFAECLVRHAMSAAQFQAEAAAEAQP
jgi:hypothetical protein